MVMLELFVGRGGASSAMRDRGWTVIGVDVLESVKPTVVARVPYLPFKPFHVDLLWASIPCDQFARHVMPWLSGPAPDLELASSVQEIIWQWHPARWAVECSAISRRWLTAIFGRALYSCSGHVIYGNIPLLVGNIAPHKERLSGRDPLARALIPRAISEAVERACSAR